MTDPENQDSHHDERNRLTSLLASIRLKIEVDPDVRPSPGVS